jgi:hypothetical protein
MEPRSWLAPHQTPKVAINAFVSVFEPYIEVLGKDYQLLLRKKGDSEKIELERHKRLRSLVVGAQRLLG